MRVPCGVQRSLCSQGRSVPSRGVSSSRVRLAHEELRASLGGPVPVLSKTPGGVGQGGRISDGLRYVSSRRGSHVGCLSPGVDGEFDRVPLAVVETLGDEGGAGSRSPGERWWARWGGAGVHSGVDL